MAETWAPYRDQVLDEAPERPRASLGRWASELWTWFGGPELAAAVRSLGAAEPAFRTGHPPDPAEPEWHGLTLPGALAEAAGVEVRVEWTTYDQEGETGIVVRARSVRGAMPHLLAGLDDRQGEWVPMEPDPEDPGLLVADLPLAGENEESALRFRTDTEGSPIKVAEGREQGPQGP